MNYCTFHKISLILGLLLPHFKNTTQFAELLSTLSFPISSPGIQIIFLNQKWPRLSSEFTEVLSSPIKTCRNTPGATQKGYLEVEKTCVNSGSDSSCGFPWGRQLYTQLDWARAEVWLQSPRTVQRPRTRAALPPAGQDVSCAGGARLAGIAQCPELQRRLVFTGSSRSLATVCRWLVVYNIPHKWCVILSRAVAYGLSSPPRPPRV